MGRFLLRGRCRYCGDTFSSRYSIVEFATGTLFVIYYVALFDLHLRGSGPSAHQWALYAIYMALVCALLAATLTDIDRAIIPAGIPWGLAIVGIVAHGAIDRQGLPGSLTVSPIAGALALGGAAGLLLAIVLLLTGVLKQSFPDGEPLLELDDEIHEREADQARKKRQRIAPRPVVSTPADARHEMRILLAHVVGALLVILVLVCLHPPRWLRPKLPYQIEPDAILDAILGLVLGLLCLWAVGILGRFTFLVQTLATARVPGGMLSQPVLKEADADGPPPAQKPVGRAEIRAEINKELQFLLLPMAGALVAALLVLYVRPVADWWANLLRHDWLSGMLGAIFGALVGGFMVWLARVLGTLVAGQIAMGLGDVHLMFGVGAMIGAGPAAVAFFLAPFAGLTVAVWRWSVRSRRELPYGPYLSLATAAVLLIYPPIAEYLRPGLQGLSQVLRGLLTGA